MLETSPFQKIREKVNHKLCENDSFNGITKVLGQQQKRRVIPVDQQIPLSFFKKKNRSSVRVNGKSKIAGASCTAPELFLAPKDHSDLDLSIGKRLKGALWKWLAQGSTGPVGWHGTGSGSLEILDTFPTKQRFVVEECWLPNLTRSPNLAPNLQNETWDKNGINDEKALFLFGASLKNKSVWDDAHGIYHLDRPTVDHDALVKVQRPSNPSLRISRQIAPFELTLQW